MTVWCLRTGRTVEIRDPKFEGRGKKGYGYKPAQTGTVGRGGRGGGRGGGGGGGGGVLAVLCRTAGQDILLLLAPRTYAVIRRIELTTVDAQGLKWSRDGRWIAIWDSAASGYGLCVYTADGHLYRTISRERSDEYNEWDVEGLGIKTVEWVPGDEWLAVGGWDRRVRILSTRTFSPAMYLDHTATIDVPGCPVYTEQVDDLKARTYKLTPQPTTPPKAPTEKSDATIIRQGISIVAFNSEGTMCATRDDSTPTTIWIWDLRSLKPRTVLIQHAAVKTFSWHPTDSSLLLIQAVQDAPTIYLYTTTSVASTSPSSIPGADAPAILDLSPKISKPAGSLPPKWDARWLPTAMDKKPALVFSHPQSYMLVYPEGKDTILRFDDAGEDSDDSLYDILTGRTPIPRLREDLDDGESDFEDDSGFQGVDADAGDIVGFEGDLPGYSTASFDDTFRERRNKVVNSKDRGESIFDESGMDEMF
ncbi:hypothetical protein K504DRAFT_457866 [Pleomassaria siparia CBS 279.74]|uniref:WD40 repeat-like protein n=1 Tax=Pleomassaria siparia CBS 279.74 TaxID=1314801 RepID=A0A6G1KS90_9PLEO|nr:hypothetical protein K504DRAFT_457866 [Pleomassaria siparia CBS 279.74]